MKQWIFLLGLTVVLAACRATRQTPVKKSDALHATITMIHNAMPSADDPPVVRKPYLIIRICPQDNTLNENIRLSALTVTGPNGTWTTTTFDHDTFSANGAMEYENVSRNFDPGIAHPYTFELTVETASGTVKTLNVANAETVVAY